MKLFVTGELNLPLPPSLPPSVSLSLPLFEVWERMKLVVEPSAAVSVAAVMNPGFRELVGPGSMRVGVVLCGGNLDLDHLPWITS